MTPLAVGIVGAGPWARSVHAPMLAAGPETRLAGVWSRSRARATDLAAPFGAVVFDTFEALVDRCDAVTFAVPPAIQPELAIEAIRRGKPVLLEKPLGLDLDDSSRVLDAVEEAGVGSMVTFTYRFSPTVRRFLDEASRFPTTAARACFMSGAFLAPRGPEEEPFAASWRARHGCLLDVGPHMLDLVDAAAGPVVEVEGYGDGLDGVSLTCRHSSGIVSEVSMSCSRPVLPSVTELTLYSKVGPLHVDGRADDRALLWSTLRSEFAAVARATLEGRGPLPHPCDVRRAHHVQGLVTMAAAAVNRHRG
jgi:predicted dehydrogenase